MFQGIFIARKKGKCRKFKHIHCYAGALVGLETDKAYYTVVARKSGFFAKEIIDGAFEDVEHYQLKIDNTYTGKAFFDIVNETQGKRYNTSADYFVSANIVLSFLRKLSAGVDLIALKDYDLNPDVLRVVFLTHPSTFQRLR